MELYAQLYFQLDIIDVLIKIGAMSEPCPSISDLAKISLANHILSVHLQGGKILIWRSKDEEPKVLDIGKLK